ncbi:uncharacterized protein PAC_04094 [Phialocephala subalpina]|uniref:Fungal N-terminal domain-containing protein n=1 Tax=Phialocephala subalpina TaxID=576137 RepID=A0A1L7WN62_9HELO|nr:uncharacterized protein PAC_04094 [Phialocephala subalpina]
MADPASPASASPVDIINGSASLALKIASVIKTLHLVAQRFKSAELAIHSIASECQTVQSAWDAVESWARKQSIQNVDQEPLLNRLRQSLLFGTMVFDALDDELMPFLSERQGQGLFTRKGAVWNEVSFARHQDRIRGQVAAMTLLLQVINLPTMTEGMNVLIRESELLKRSDETAWTIVDSSASFSSRLPDSRTSMESSDTAYVRYDFEPELLAGRVYGRSYKYLAGKLQKRRGKEGIRNIRAELFVNTMGEDENSDKASIFSVSRSSRREVIPDDYSRLLSTRRREHHPPLLTTPNIDKDEYPILSTARQASDYRTSFRPKSHDAPDLKDGNALLERQEGIEASGNEGQDASDSDQTRGNSLVEDDQRSRQEGMEIVKASDMDGSTFARGAATSDRAEKTVYRYSPSTQANASTSPSSKMLRRAQSSPSELGTIEVSVDMNGLSPKDRNPGTNSLEQESDSDTSSEASGQEYPIPTLQEDLPVFGFSRLGFGSRIATSLFALTAEEA